jgi:hypothetical protein
VPAVAADVPAAPTNLSELPLPTLKIWIEHYEDRINKYIGRYDSHHFALISLNYTIMYDIGNINNMILKCDYFLRMFNILEQEPEPEQRKAVIKLVCEVDTEIDMYYPMIKLMRITSEKFDHMAYYIFDSRQLVHADDDKAVFDRTCLSQFKFFFNRARYYYTDVKDTFDKVISNYELVWGRTHQFLESKSHSWKVEDGDYCKTRIVNAKEILQGSSERLDIIRQSFIGVIQHVLTLKDVVRNYYIEMINKLKIEIEERKLLGGGAAYEEPDREFLRNVIQGLDSEVDPEVVLNDLEGRKTQGGGMKKKSKRRNKGKSSKKRRTRRRTTRTSRRTRR